MVSDLHQILLKGGGLFSYPATSDHPNGKLRVVFEVLPFAFIYENAKGATSNGKNQTLFDIKIEKFTKLRHASLAHVMKFHFCINFTSKNNARITSKRAT